MNSYINESLQTIICGATALVRGVRVVRASDGEFDVAGATVRGDFATMDAVPIGEAAPAQPMQGEATLPLLSLTTAAVGDLAYAAADGKVSTTSTNAALVGRYRTAVAVANTLGEVQLLSVA